MSPVADLNALSVLQPRRLLVTKAALDALEGAARQASREGQAAASEAGDQQSAATASKDMTMASETHRHAERPLLEPHQIILRPLVTEKGMHRSTRNNAYAFEVNRMATKDDVRRAVEELFNVKVLAVHTQNRKGKPRRTPVPQRPHQGLEEGDRHARSGAPDRLLLIDDVVRAASDDSAARAKLKDQAMGIRRYNPTTPGAAGRASAILPS